MWIPAEPKRVKIRIIRHSHLTRELRYGNWRESNVSQLRWSSGWYYVEIHRRQLYMDDCSLSPYPAHHRPSKNKGINVWTLNSALQNKFTLLKTMNDSVDLRNVLAGAMLFLPVDLCGINFRTIKKFSISVDHMVANKCSEYWVSRIVRKRKLTVGHTSRKLWGFEPLYISSKS